MLSLARTPYRFILNIWRLICVYFFCFMRMFLNAILAKWLCVRMFVSPVDTKSVTALVSRIGTKAAVCRSAASGQWTPQPIYSSLTTESKQSNCPLSIFQSRSRGFKTNLCCYTWINWICAWMNLTDLWHWQNDRK